MIAKENADQSTLKQPQFYHFHFLSIVFCFWFSTFIYIPTFGVYLELLDIGYYASGMIMGSYGIMQIIMRFPLGIIADKYKISGKVLVSCGFVASFISAILLALTGEFLTIFFGRFLAGVTAAMWVVLTIWYSSSFDQSRSLKAMGLLQTTTVGSQLISMAISAWITSLFGFKSLFWIGGIFALIGLILVLLLPRGGATKERDQKKRKTEHEELIVRRVLKEQKIWSLSLLSLLAHAVLFATIFGFSPVYFNSLNGHSSAIMLLVIAFMFPHALAPMLLTVKKGSFSNPFIVLAFCFGIGAGSLLLMGYTNNWLAYCFLHAILGLFLGFVFPVLLDQVYKTNSIAATQTLMGLYQSVYSIGIVVGPLAAGYFARQVNLRAVFIMSAVFLIAGGVVSLVETMKIKKEE
jgi:predicted MFS family arabinose efflux permease